MARLPIEVSPRAEESVSGFMLRVLVANGASPRDLLALTRGSTRRLASMEDVPLFSVLTGVDRQWFAERVPTEVRGDRWMEIEVFSSRWRNDWTLRGQYCQVCPQCLIDQGYARLEWDLTAFVVCPVHRRLLVDRCQSCGRALQPNRPAVDVCRCGGFIEGGDSAAADVEPAVVAWCQWLSDTLMAGLATGASATPPPMAELNGLSMDGAYRMVVSLGGGTRELRGAHLNSTSPWLDTRAAYEVLRAGLAALRDIEAGRALATPLGLGCGDAMSEQTVRGITAFDRHAAASMLSRLKLRSRWRNVKPVVHAQGDLFGEWT